MVFIEFLKQYLIEQGIPKEEINISPQLTNIEKLKLLLYSIIDLTNGELKAKALKFYKIKEQIYSDDKVMIKFLLFLKELYQGINLSSSDSFYTNTNFNIVTEQKYETKENKNTISNANEANSVIYHSTGNDKKIIPSQQNNNIIDDYSIKDNNNGNILKEEDNTIVNDINFEVSSQIKAHKENQSATTQQEQQDNSNSKKFTLSPGSKENTFRYSLSPTKSATFSISPNTNNINHSFLSFNLLKQNKLKSGERNNNKKLKAQIQVMTGIYSLSTSKNPKIDKFSYDSNISQPLPLVIFYRPTNPIIDINLTTIKKMYPIFLKDDNKFIKKVSNLKKIPIMFNPNKRREYSIKKWLLSLSLISQKSMNVSISKLIKDGVLLCDLINCCERKRNVIQGILRNPNTKAQMKVNLMKACDYIRGMNGIYPYINSICLNFEEEILKENDNVTTTLIDGLYKYYNNKISNKQQFSLSISKIPKIDILSARNLNKNGTDKFINEFYEIQSLSSRKSQTINTFKLQKHKKHFSSNGNAFDTSTFFLNGSSSFNSDNYFQQLMSHNVNSPQPLIQISNISGIPKHNRQLSPSELNLSLIISPSNNNSSVVNWQESESEMKTRMRLYKSKIQNQKKRSQSSKGNLNCLLLFKKENLGLMKKEMRNKERILKSKEIKFE